MRLFNKVTIIGVGLIGGSIGMGMKSKRLAGKVIGVCRHRNSLKLAKKRAAIDEGFLDLKRAVVGADLLILAAPIGNTINLAKRAAPFLKPGAVITDVGSTKASVVAALEKVFFRKNFFIGGHPLAGSEKSGISQAKKSLFNNAVCIITRTRKTNSQALGKVCQLWRRLGAKVVIMEPKRHDSIVAAVSHMPHIIANALVLSIDKRKTAFAAGGLRDTTRIALSDPLLWRDIFLTNGKEILEAVDRFRIQLERLSIGIKNSDNRLLFSLLKKAKLKRDSFD